MYKSIVHNLFFLCYLLLVRGYWCLEFDSKRTMVCVSFQQRQSQSVTRLFLVFLFLDLLTCELKRKLTCSLIQLLFCPYPSYLTSILSGISCIMFNDIFLNLVKLVDKEENHMATPEVSRTNMLFVRLCLKALFGIKMEERKTEK